MPRSPLQISKLAIPIVSSTKGADPTRLHSDQCYSGADTLLNMMAHDSRQPGKPRQILRSGSGIQLELAALMKISESLQTNRSYHERLQNLCARFLARINYCLSAAIAFAQQRAHIAG